MFSKKGFYFDLGLIILSFLALLLGNIFFLFFVSLVSLGMVIGNALRSLIQRRLTIDLLASIALIFSLLAQEWRSAVFISLMLASARLFARYTGGQARQAIQSLLKLRPSKAHILVNGKITEVNIDEIKVNDLVVVESGERSAVDGFVESGEADIDQSSLTGESEPITKTPGSEVFSSTLNIGGSLVIRATRVGQETTFSKILDLVEKSQASKAPIIPIINRFANWYILITLVGSALIYFFTQNLTLVLSILLVTCADDLAVAVPLAFTAAIGTAARRGVIVKDGNFLEGLLKIKIMVFDKTGTITEGRPQVQTVATFNHYSQEKFLALLGAVENESEHPTAKAIEKFLAEKKIKIPEVFEVHEQPGYGISGFIAGKKFFAGKVKFLENQGLKFSPAELHLIEEEKNKHRTLTVLGTDKKVLGFISFLDAIRLEADQAINELKTLGIKKMVMLTGDNEEIAHKIAQKVGLHEFQANLSPEDKINFLQTILKPDYKVAMVGDGVNDAAALSLVDVGIAMGAIGSDAAVESADIVLMKDNLLDIPRTIKLGRYLMKIVRQDLWLWGITNAVGLILALCGIFHPSTAAAYNFLTDFLPLLNSLKLFKLHLNKKI